MRACLPRPRKDAHPCCLPAAPAPLAAASRVPWSLCPAHTVRTPCTPCGTVGRQPTLLINPPSECRPPCLPLLHCCQLPGSPTQHLTHSLSRAQTMADAPRGGFSRGFGDRGRGDRGRGDRGRGDRGRGGRGRGRKDEEEKWVPCTKLGRLVQQVRRRRCGSMLGVLAWLACNTAWQGGRGRCRLVVAHGRADGPLTPLALARPARLPSPAAADQQPRPPSPPPHPHHTTRCRAKSRAWSKFTCSPCPSRSARLSTTSWAPR